MLCWRKKTIKRKKELSEHCTVFSDKKRQNFILFDYFFKNFSSFEMRNKKIHYLKRASEQVPFCVFLNHLVKKTCQVTVIKFIWYSAGF